MVIQAFIDESVTQDGLFVMGGYIATAEAWATFSKRWEELLPLATIDRLGRRRFKMKEMAWRRMSDVSAFYRIIEESVLMYISCTIHAQELKNAFYRLWVPGKTINWGDWTNPHFMCLRGLLDRFHADRIDHPDAEKFAKLIPLGEQVTFYFDEHSSKNIIIKAWDEYIGNAPDKIRGLYGATPRFGDDIEFLPLQAADFWAWWVRRGWEDGKIDNYRAGDFGLWKGKREIDGMTISFTEDALTKAFVPLIREQVPDVLPIYD